MKSLICVAAVALMAVLMPKPIEAEAQCFGIRSGVNVQVGGFGRGVRVGNRIGLDRRRGRVLNRRCNRDLVNVIDRRVFVEQVPVLLQTQAVSTFQSYSGQAFPQQQLPSGPLSALTAATNETAGDLEELRAAVAALSAQLP